MLGKIISVMGDVVRVKLEANLYDLDNLMGKNVIFEENDIKIVGEILEGDVTYLDINFTPHGMEKDVEDGEGVSETSLP